MIYQTLATNSFRPSSRKRLWADSQHLDTLTTSSPVHLHFRIVQPQPKNRLGGNVYVAVCSMEISMGMELNVPL